MGSGGLDWELSDEGLKLKLKKKFKLRRMSDKVHVCCCRVVFQAV
jgi:hypothetical protein